MKHFVDNTSLKKTSLKASYSEKNFEYYDFNGVYKTLKHQQSRRLVETKINNKKFTIKNTYSDSIGELELKPADQLYNYIRASINDIPKIASNLGYKRKKVDNLKNCLFFDDHLLNKYDEIEFKTFDPSLYQALD